MSATYSSSTSRSRLVTMSAACKMTCSRGSSPVISRSIQTRLPASCTRFTRSFIRRTVADSRQAGGSVFVVVVVALEVVVVLVIALFELRRYVGGLLRGGRRCGRAAALLRQL